MGGERRKEEEEEREGSHLELYENVVKWPHNDPILQGKNAFLIILHDKSFLKISSTIFMFHFLITCKCI